MWTQPGVRAAVPAADAGTHRGSRGSAGVPPLVAGAAAALLLAGTVVSVSVLGAGSVSLRTRAGAHPPVAAAFGALVGPRASVGPLTHRADPYLFVTTDRSLTRTEIDRLGRAVGASEAVVADFAEVSVGSGRTGAIGADPNLLRTVAPAGTAEVTALWQRIADGEIAVAHSVAAALDVRLGGQVDVGHDRPVGLRIGALATIRLPGVGVVVDRSRSAALGLVADSAVALVVPGTPDPVLLAATARQAVQGLRVMSLRTVLPPPAVAPSAPSASSWSAPGTPPQDDPPAPGAAPRSPQPPAAADTVESGWVPPVIGTISRGFNPTTGSERHLGLDIAAPLGTPIMAAAAGYVLYAGPASGFGNEIVLQHGDGVETVYGHMRVFMIRGGTVAAGQQIALVGNEGHSTGPHLHFEVHVGDRPVDPLAWLREHHVRI
ncbi:M23 family metallopeptidase [Frankia sp. CiP3]|uniref:M23 family metallopeptidase n=1 Tax=Frankia sp. CiP3 TaxID=2880971 RepID=UPI001EF56843|nr:M23 family metallopeptidase [Frankia sp. CiP3]